MIDKHDYYRLPWTMNDNPMAWIEVTDICNLHCEGCYRLHLTGHKNLESLKDEVLFLIKWRNLDSLSIAGGEPLIYPYIIELVAFIAQQGIKPVILSNGESLNPEILHKLKEAGLAGFTIHIDSHQNRPHWQNRSEKDHNSLRQNIANMVHSEGGLFLVFNSTIYPNTLHEISDIVQWGHTNIEKVQGLVFVTYRTTPNSDNIATDKNNQTININKLSYPCENMNGHIVTATEIYQMIKEKIPEYDISSYIGGNINHYSIKWLVGSMIGSKHQIYGSIGKKTMELSQIGHHLWTGRYMAYLSKTCVGQKVFFLSFWDKFLYNALKNRIKDILKNPSHLFDAIFTQSIVIIQGPDLMPDGRVDMCEGCPDITLYDGNFVSSCRMDEYRLFGGYISIFKKDKK